uniref:Pescadillo homolog n=1 Tax=Scapholeberis mucronata TaxID=202097 RepID=A0A4Y7NK34_9CRUS|nr:EOG090X05E6 [Scapholeberis mucronata]SVE93591.1 EOG090X05E6 [Scapholeberis mucronata]
MGARMKKKYEAGEATKYITRAQALKKLQLNLKDFRRLCILKGVYPREPNNRKKAQKGKLDKKTLYYEKDIRFLSHEPLIWKFREFKVFMRKIKTATEKGDRETALRLKENKPSLELDHLVKERYPTFMDALNDLDDCLTLCFFYSTLPRDTKAPSPLIALCRRLTVEFMHYVIAAKALRKVFISVKGIYYQVEIKGQPVTILVNHQRGFKPTSVSDVDYRIMTNFVDFYTTMLGFINFRLYHSINLKYPPKLPGLEVKEDADDEMAVENYNELVAALNSSLVTNVPQMEEELQIDEFPTAEGAEMLEEAKKDAQAVQRLQSLFKGMKFFISREVPRESLVFVIRSCDGEVSWDASIFAGATYDETDESITHQIVDRPSVDKQYLSRYYIQPQWVFDCINFRSLLPVEDYFIGANLPPHISPFVTERLGDYIPPEKQMLLAMERGETLPVDDQEENNSEAEEESEDDDDSPDTETDKNKSTNSNVVKEKNGMKVLRGRVEAVGTKELEQEEKEHYRFRELMIRNKDKRLYRSMMDNRKNRIREAKRLEMKRKQHEKEAKDSKSKATAKDATAKWSIQPVSSPSDTPSKKMKKSL